jgi:hypothetical protein
MSHKDDNEKKPSIYVVTVISNPGTSYMKIGWKTTRWWLLAVVWKIYYQSKYKICHNLYLRRMKKKKDVGEQSSGDSSYTVRLRCGSDEKEVI